MSLTWVSLTRVNVFDMSVFDMSQCLWHECLWHGSMSLTYVKDTRCVFDMSRSYVWHDSCQRHPLTRHIWNGHGALIGSLNEYDAVGVQLVVSHVWMRHVTRTHWRYSSMIACDTHGYVISHMWMSHGTQPERGRCGGCADNEIGDMTHE